MGTRLRKISRIADGYYRKHLKAYGITENQLTILFALSKMGKIEQGKLGERLLLERSTVSRNVKLLCYKELVHKTNAYRPEIELTEKGMALVHKLLPLWEEIMDELIGKIGEDGMELIGALEKKFL